ncbi:hypothetical protein ACIQAC_16510 [Streptomyces sp. NPDC088387]|uniref:VMAP-C domain-containing protein n=1 Tax=Streptomyces sp. NPDC088387 TaxID=3365859 RepID=UPI003813F679
MRLTFQLTEALCELSCMEEPHERTQFALVLGEQLAQPVDVRGVKLRQDVVVLVRAALSVAGGEHVLVRVVELFEGAAAADKLERLLPSPAPPAAAVVPPGPLSARDESTARALLADAGPAMSAGALRDDLARELNGLYLPPGLTPERLFAHVVQWNVQPDGLPPAVLLVDLAARHALAPRHRGELTRWVDTWAADHPDLNEAVRRRRGERTASVSDPDIPHCLVVAVEPAGDGSGEIVVRTWLNAVPGHWDPLPADPVVTTLDGLGAAVEDVFRRSGRLWAERREPESGRTPPLYIEFVLPYDLLHHDVARLRLALGDGRPLPIGPRFGVHVRSLERMRTDDVLVRAQWRERWRALREHGVLVHGWSEPDADRPDAWQMALAGEARHTAVVLDSPTGGFAREALKTAIAEGIGLAIWDRRGVFEAARRETVTAVFASVVMPEHLPRAIRRWRYEAERRESHDLGRHIGFFWDDPTRLVDLQPFDLDPLDPAFDADPLDHNDLAS